MKLKMWHIYKHMLAADICQPENLEPNHRCVNKAQRLHHIQPNLPPKITKKLKKPIIALAIYMFGS
jgi:hypothetical protein